MDHTSKSSYAISLDNYDAVVSGRKTDGSIAKEYKVSLSIDNKYANSGYNPLISQ